MMGRRTPEQLAAAINVGLARKRGPEAVAAAKRLKAEVKAEARKRRTP
ncbi:hypothetical protein [Streptomyces sp. MZ04]|nr:hypothetical protein [Streptomyces sp. MZ04]